MFSRRQNVNHNPQKFDALFYNSIGLAKNTYRNKAICNAGKIILLLVFLIVDNTVLNSKNWRLNIFMRFGIATSAINLIINLIIRCVGYSNNQRNNKFFINLAEAVGHSVAQQRLDNPDDIRQIQRCASSYIYNARNRSNINDPALTKDIRNRYQKINRNLIQSQVLQNYKCLPILDLIGRIFSLATVIYGIVLLATLNPPATIPELVVLGLYILLQCINIWVVILILLIIAFSPFICCFGCIYLCCFGSKMFINRDTLNIPEPTKANAQIIEQCEGSCTICLQDFNLKDKLIILTCSPKHVFHEKCILSWLRVADSCPICRTPVPKTI